MKVDVLVVGLGPAGSRAAFVAARAGLSVLAIERRARAGEPVQCAELVPALLQQEVADLGRYTAQRVSAMGTYVEDGPREVTPDFPGAMIDRSAFDAALAAAAQAAGTACRYRIALAALDDHGEAHLSDGTCIRARFVVGADGPRSRVGRAIGRMNRELTEARQITVPLLQAHAATDIFLSEAMPGGYGWLFPKGAYAHVGVGVEHSAAARLPALLARLHERLARERRVGSTIVRQTGGAIPAGGLLDAAGTHGETCVLLAGDAAGLANPVTGAGIAAAIQSGALAGAAAAAWIGGDAAAPARYVDELEDLFGAALARAVARRRALLDAHTTGGVSRHAQRRAWIAYPEYWAA